MGWIIAGAVVIFILLLTLGRVTLYFDYNEDVFVMARYLCFTLFKVPAEKKKIKKRDKKEKKAVEKVEKEAEKKSEKISLSEILDLVKTVMNSLGKPLRKILKRTEISRLTLNITCGGEDAAKAALNYGRMNILVGNALGLLDSFFTLKKINEVNVGVDFYNEKTTANCYLEVRLTLAAALAFVFTLFGRFVKNLLSDKKAQNAVKKMV